MILSEQQEQIIRNLVAEKEFKYASELAKEMLVVKHFNLDAEDFEDDYDYQWAMKYDSDWLKVVNHYLKASIEVFQLDENNEPDGWCEFETFGFLGRDNKIYDQWFCEIPLKDFKQKYGVNKKDLLALNDTDNTFVVTKTDEAIEMADDLEIYFSSEYFNTY